MFRRFRIKKEILTGIVIPSIIAAVIVVFSCMFAYHKINRNIQEIKERSYFEGQRDALTGDIRIQKQKDSSWVWIKSPWNAGVKPLFNPK